MSAHYDVIVLDAGSSGYVAAIRAAQLGKNIQSGSPAVRQCGQRTAANPVHNLGSAAQPGRSSGTATGVLSMGSGSVHVTHHAFHPGHRPPECPLALD